MRYGSVCSGIEAATVAWEPLGWQAEFCSEIDPFPCHVLHEHYSSGRPAFMPDPDEPGLKAKDRKARAAAIKAVSSLPERANGVPNHGDMTQFEEWPDHAIDLLVGGTPCQDYSIAGLRAGMDGVRGSLTLTYAAIARRYRPRWLVWENVFGVLSSKGGRDFASFLGLLSGRRIEVPADGWKSAGIVEGYGGAYGLAWRVLDTQYVRVDGAPRALPQRRRRVFVVGHSGGDWRRAAAVLFEREGLSGNLAPRREPGKGVASATEVGFGGGRCSGPVDVAASLAAHGNRQDFEVETFVAHSLRPEGFDASEDGTGRGTPLVSLSVAIRGRDEGGTVEMGDDVAHALRASQGGGDKPHVLAPVAYSIMPQNSGKDYKARQVEVAQPIMAGGPVGGNQGGDYICDPVAFSSKDYGADASEGVSPTLRAMGHADSHPNAGGQIAIAHAIQAGALRENPSCGPDGVGVQEGIAYTIEARAEVQAVQTQWAVRRLTPTECARLQGFADNHCRIPWRGKPAEQCPDGPQYKAYGNSMSTNVMRWIGQRIEVVDALEFREAAE